MNDVATPEIDATEGALPCRHAGCAVWDCGPLGYWHRELPAEPVLPGQVDDTTPLKLVSRAVPHNGE